MCAHVAKQSRLWGHSPQRSSLFASLGWSCAASPSLLLRLDDLDIAKDQMDDVAVAHAHYVITQNARTLAAVRYLSRADYVSVGETMNQSHNSMKESCEVRASLSPSLSLSLSSELRRTTLQK
jgi:PHD/YefM family antitoxin component YafN of YafNO toxin-antitoxin module